jgi:hypothetical protein
MKLSIFNSKETRNREFVLSKLDAQGYYIAEETCRNRFLVIKEGHKFLVNVMRHEVDVFPLGDWESNDNYNREFGKLKQVLINSNYQLISSFIYSRR